jgi:hypothetical protein
MCPDYAGQCLLGPGTIILAYENDRPPTTRTGQILLGATGFQLAQVQSASLVGSVLAS